jgi:hypothetical protein
LSEKRRQESAILHDAISRNFQTQYQMAIYTLANNGLNAIQAADIESDGGADGGGQHQRAAGL